VPLVLAVAAHTALLVAIARGPNDGTVGGGGQQLDAISVTLVNSGALEAREPNVAQPPSPAAPAPVETEDGSAKREAALPREKKEATEEKQSPPEPVQATAPVPLPPEKLEQDRQEEARAPAAAGGIAVRGDAPTALAPQSAPAAASPGAVREYARYVSQALAKGKPRGFGALGTVRVRLVISPRGGLASVGIVKSSGNRRLDEIAIAAVKHTALPPPPQGMTSAQLTYEVPYHFR
jgi:periplasmic protein TonB